MEVVKDDTQEVLAEMQQRVTETMINIKGCKQAVVMYLLNLMGKKISDRNLKKVVVIPLKHSEGVISAEKFVFKDKGGRREVVIAAFQIVLTQEKKFEISFKTPMNLTEEQQGKCAELLNYKHVFNGEGK